MHQVPKFCEMNTKMLFSSVQANLNPRQLIVIMNDAALYSESNYLQTRDALHYLEEFAKNMKWKATDDRVIDIGSGDGRVTNNLKKYIPANFSKLVGCDISENMVNFANEYYKQDRTTFTVLDIGGTLPEEFLEGFDHAFSFFTLQWVKQQEKAFTNIYSLLAEGGECLLIFPSGAPLFYVLLTLARREKYSSWLKDIDLCISPYHGIQEPAKIIKNMMEKVGFININVKCEDKFFIYDNLNTLKKAITAITPLKIPKNLYNDFIEDCLEEMNMKNMIPSEKNDIGETVNVKFSYSLIVAYASKR